MDGTETDRGAPRLARALAAVWLLAWITTFALLLANRSAFHAVSEADLIDLILPIGFAIIGTLIASRQARNPIGWIFLGIAIIGALSGVIT